MLCSICEPLAAYRAELSALFGARRDALLELIDALLAADPVASPVHPSLAPLHRRAWGSQYAALAYGEIPADAIEALLAAHPLAGGEAIKRTEVTT